MDIRQINDWLTLVLVLWSAGLTATLWLRKPGVEAATAIAAIKEEQRAKHELLNNRITTLEERVKHMPTSNELSELEGAVKAISERTEGLTEAIGTVRSTLGRIETFLLSHQKR
jgi:cell division protein FtsB